MCTYLPRHDKAPLSDKSGISEEKNFHVSQNHASCCRDGVSFCGVRLILNNLAEAYHSALVRVLG